MTAPTYTPQRTVVTDTAGGITALQALAELARDTAPSYSAQLWRVDASGVPLEDLTPYLLKGSSRNAVSRSCGDELAGKLNITLAKELRWGSDRIAPMLLARPERLGLLEDPGQWYAFRCGTFVATSPGNDNLDAVGKYVVTGYDPVYLLQSGASTSFAFGAGSTYLAAVTAVFRGAGVLGSSAPLSDVCSYPGAWAAKILPAADTFPVSDGDSHVSIVNSLLKESGCRTLYADPHTGRYVIELIPNPQQQSLRWRWSGDDNSYAAAAGYPDVKVVLYGQQAYTGDVYNAPNQWVFTQSGLTFTPTHSDGSDGRYIVNNPDGGPAAQNVVGRVVTSSRSLEASGTADLIAQSDAIVAAERAQQETVTLSTAPWPAAGHFDVFLYAHSQLPGSSVRRLQAQGWTLPLDGSPMTWQTNVVGSQ